MISLKIIHLYHPFYDGNGRTPRYTTFHAKYQSTNISKFYALEEFYAESFEQADPRYQLAVVVAQYAETLRHSPWAAETYAPQLVAHAYRVSSLLWENTEVTEFASLVSRASQISALGN